MQLELVIDDTNSFSEALTFTEDGKLQGTLIKDEWKILQFSIHKYHTHHNSYRPSMHSFQIKHWEENVL